MIIFVVNVYYIIVNLCSFQFCYLAITRRVNDQFSDKPVFGQPVFKNEAV